MKRRPFHALLCGAATLCVALPAHVAAQGDCAPSAAECRTGLSAAAPTPVATDTAAASVALDAGAHAATASGAASRSDLTRLAPVVSLATQSQWWRDVSQGASTLSYSTPAYVSHDVPRSLSLFYSSGQAAPMGAVDLQVTDNSTDTPVKMSIRVRDPWGAWVTNEIFYNAGNGVTRLAATWDASAYGTGTYWFPVVVRSYWSDGTYTEAPAVNVGVVIVNERNSHAGIGWSLPGWETIIGQTFNGPDGVTIVNGDGSAAFFRKVCSPTCSFVSPPGDWTSLAQYSDGYIRTYPDGSITSYQLSGRIWYRKDRFGNEIDYQWVQLSDGTYAPSWITDPTGKSITMGYTGAGKLAWIQDPMLRVSNVAINAAGDLTNVQTPALGSDAIVAQYDAQHRLTQYWDRASALTSFYYDVNGLVYAQQLAPVRLAGQTTDTRPIWYYTQQLSRILPASGKGTQANPGDRRQPADVFASITDPRGKVRWMVTDRFGLPTQDINPFGWSTTIQRNDSGQVTRVTTPSGHSVRYTWSGVELTKEVDETAGDSTVVDYEHTYHQPTHVKRAAAEVWNTYGTHGELLTTKVGLNPTTTYTYDAQGRVLSAVDPEQHGTFYDYEGDAVGTGGNLGLVQVGAVGASNRRQTQITHDVYGRTVATYFPNGDSAHVDYDVLNRRTRSVDGAGNVTRFFHGMLYVDSITDAKGQAYRFYHNALGWADSVADPNGYRERSYFDADGNVTSAVNRRGQTVSYGYDDVNRVTSRTADGATTTWAYAIDDRWVAGANAESTDTVFYDMAGRPSSRVSVRSGVRYVLSSTYNAQGQRTALTMTAPWSRSIGYRYTPNAQLDTLIDLGGGRTLFDYNGDGQNTGIYLPNNVSTLFGVTSTHADANIEYNALTTPHSLDRGFSIDRMGRVSERWNFAGDTSRAYTFDRAGRLTNFQDWHVVDATCTGTSFGVENGAGACEASPYREVVDLDYSTGAFTYDAVGNRTDQSATVAWGNRLMSFGSYTMSYDADGNMLTKNGLGKSRTYTWNSLGQLVSVTTNGATTSFGYDAFGNRVRKTTPTAVSRYVVDGDNLFMELDGSGNPVREYTFFPGVDQPHSMRSGTQTYYYLTEPSGTVVGMVNSSRVAVNTYQYDPWGFVTNVQEAVANPLRFNAREYDAETGLYYNRGRYYEPELGRFISEDPISLEGGINPFAYASNDPVNRTDPFGLDDSDTWSSHECHKTDNFGWSTATTNSSSCDGISSPALKDAIATLRDFMNAFSHANDVWVLGLKAGPRAAGGGNGNPLVNLADAWTNDDKECADAMRKAVSSWANDFLTLGGLSGATKGISAVGRLRNVTLLERDAKMAEALKTAATGAAATGAGVLVGVLGLDRDEPWWYAFPLLGSAARTGAEAAVCWRDR